MDPDEARFAAQREFGGVEQVKEQVRDESRWAWLEHTVQDLRNAVRQLRKAPGVLDCRGAIACALIGIAGAITATRLIQSQLYGLSSTDPASYSMAVLLVAAVVMIACLLPARRAAKMDPMVALRCE